MALGTARTCGARLARELHEVRQRQGVLEGPARDVLHGAGALLRDQHEQRHLAGRKYSVQKL